MNSNHDERGRFSSGPGGARKMKYVHGSTRLPSKRAAHGVLDPNRKAIGAILRKETGVKQRESSYVRRVEANERHGRVGIQHQNYDQGGPHNPAGFDKVVKAKRKIGKQILKEYNAKSIKLRQAHRKPIKVKAARQVMKGRRR